MSSQSLPLNLQVCYLPSVLRLSRLDKQLLPAGQCNSLLKLNYRNKILLFSFYFLLFRKIFSVRKPPNMAASVIGKLVQRIIEMRILKLVDSDISLDIFSKQNNR